MILSFYFNLVGATQCSIKVLSFEDSKLRNSMFSLLCFVIESCLWSHRWARGLGVQFSGLWSLRDTLSRAAYFFQSFAPPPSFIFICCICSICPQGRNPRSPLPWSSVFRVTVIEGCPEPGRLVFSVICPLCLPGWSLDMNILKISTPQIVPIFFNVTVNIIGVYKYS